MSYNQEIMNLISDDRYIQHMAYDALRKKWSQLNENTRIQFVNHHTVYIPRNDPIPAPRPVTKQRAASGWQVFRLFLLGEGGGNKLDLASLEDPEMRWHYSKNLFKTGWMAFKYPFWRVVGRVFNRPDWTARGMEKYQDYGVVPTVVASQREEIRLEHFRYVTEIDQRMPRSPWQEQEYRDFYCAYHAATDTLYVWRR